MRFFRQEYWSGLPFSPPRNLPNPGIESVSPALTGRFFTTEPLGSPQILRTTLKLYDISKANVLFVSLTSIFATIGKPTLRKSIA